MVDYIAPPSKFNSLVQSRVLEVSKTVKYRDGKKECETSKNPKKIENNNINYENNFMFFNREQRTAEIIIKGPKDKDIISLLEEALKKEAIGGL